MNLEILARSPKTLESIVDQTLAVKNDGCASSKWPDSGAPDDEWIQATRRRIVKAQVHEATSTTAKGVLRLVTREGINEEF